jgi:hypothetical protein
MSGVKDVERQVDRREPGAGEVTLRVALVDDLAGVSLEISRLAEAPGHGRGDVFEDIERRRRQCEHSNCSTSAVK